MDRWGTRWAREGGHIKQVTAPGHRRKRCCYVDFLSTSPAVAATLRHQVGSVERIRRLSNVAAIEICVAGGRVRGVVALDLSTGSLTTIAAPAVVLAAGGLTKIFAAAAPPPTWEARRAGWRSRRAPSSWTWSSCSSSRLRTWRRGWSAWTRSCGTRSATSSVADSSTAASRNSFIATAAKTRSLYRAAGPRLGRHSQRGRGGRGSPHGGVLDFRHIPEDQLRSAFGPVIDRLLGNGIDLTRVPVEVAPTAHYHMGGIAVDERLETRVEGLFAAGEAVGGAGGANRVSGNAITEALVFGERAGYFAAAAAEAGTGWSSTYAEPARAELETLRQRKGIGPPRSYS